MRLCAPLPAAPVAAQPKHSMLKLSLLVATLAQSALAAPRASTCVAYPSKCSRPDKNMTSDDQALRTQVCQQAGTEQPTGRCIPFNDAGAPGGNFTCSCCGNALFAASQWYDASTGWPAFKTTLGPQVRRGPLCAALLLLLLLVVLLLLLVVLVMVLVVVVLLLLLRPLLLTLGSRASRPSARPPPPR